MLKKGVTVDIDIPRGERSAEGTIGQKGSLLSIPLANLEAEHLFIRVKREPDSTDYEVTIRRGGPVLIKYALNQDFEKMTGSETFTDEEVKEAGGIRFRLSDRIKDEEMATYVEIGLNWDTFLPEGATKERKKFFVTIEEYKGKPEAVSENLYRLIDPDAL
ncbi:MAG: hypothetical protein D6767_08350 [Candidatus Hydrogenedentota bacterium]|nr:MAG: hypothetical protein D6767_08350 [Candidatus Hydrogenedentota bacterium]